MPVEPLSKGMILRIVDDFIGAPGGDLSGLSHRKLGEFYPRYCGLDIDLGPFSGTKREKFTDILREMNPKDQAKILKGVLDKYPVGEEFAPETRTREFAEEIRAEIGRLEGVSPVDAGSLSFTVDVVEKAIRDAKKLIETVGATSAVDRVHTAMHGYIRGVCNQAGIALGKYESLPSAFGKLRAHHPALKLIGDHAAQTRNILSGIGTMFDAMDRIRDKNSLAHPNEQLFPPVEAMLMVNLIHSLLHYLDSKLASSP